MKPTLLGFVSLAILALAGCAKEPRAWLGNFDSTFIAVTGTPVALEAALRAVGMPPALREGELPGGAGYGMSHAAQLWAFTPDDSAHVVYPWGMRREDLAADIATLLRIWPPAP